MRRSRRYAVRIGGTTVAETLVAASFCAPCESENIAAQTAAIRRREQGPDPFVAGSVPEPLAEQAAAATAPAYVRAEEDGTIARWEGVIAVEGKPTGDGRLIELDALYWGELPIPLRWDIEDDGEHRGAVVVGLIEEIERRPGGEEGCSEIYGRGFVDLVSENGYEAARLLAKEMLRGVSIDPDDVDFEIRVAGEIYDDLMIIEPIAEGEEDPSENGELAEDPAPRDAEGRVTVAEIRSDDEMMVISEARIRAATLVDTPAFVQARIALCGDLPARPAPASIPEALVASAAIAAPVRPPAAWFANPKFSGPSPLTVREDGRVLGHIALWDTCHTGIASSCVTPPRSATSYSWFRTGVLLADDGSEITVGQITLDTGHAGPSLGATAAVAHYDNTGRAVADVTAGEDAYGPWIAGALRPGVSVEALRALRGSKMSGDWRRIGGNLELCAVLAVNMPGFPVPRSFVASGRAESLFVPIRMNTAPDPSEAAGGELSNGERAELRSLLASAERERRAEASELHIRVAADALARSVRYG